MTGGLGSARFPGRVARPLLPVVAVADEDAGAAEVPVERGVLVAWVGILAVDWCVGVRRWSSDVVSRGGAGRMQTRWFKAALGLELLKVEGGF